MNAEDSKPYKERLLALRAQLRGDVSQMADAVLEKTLMQANGDLSSMPIHMADIGTDNFEREFTLTLMESKDRTLEQIEEALGVSTNSNFLRFTTFVPSRYSQSKRYSGYHRRFLPAP